jgi:hypothetical protein
MSSFDVSRISINVTGAQTFTNDAHVTTRADRTPAELISVTVGSLLVQVHDLPAARAFATACRSASGYLPATFPHRAPNPVADAEGRTPGVVLRVEGSPSVNRINGFGAAYGAPHVRIHLGRLVVRFFDLDALLSWSAGWDDVERLAQRLWPEPDAFERAEARERLRIARTGRSTRSTSKADAT